MSAWFFALWFAFPFPPNLDSKLLELNPQKQTPFLVVEGNKVLSQSAAITTFLIKSSSCPEAKKLLGSSPFEESQILSQIAQVDSELLSGGFSLLQRTMTGQSQPSKDSLKAAWADLKEVVNTYNMILKKAKVLSGSAFSAADIHLLSVLVPVYFPSFK